MKSGAVVVVTDLTELAVDTMTVGLGAWIWWSLMV